MCFFPCFSCWDVADYCSRDGGIDYRDIGVEEDTIVSGWDNFLVVGVVWCWSRVRCFGDCREFPLHWDDLDFDHALLGCIIIIFFFVFPSSRDRFFGSPNLACRLFLLICFLPGPGII